MTRQQGVPTITINLDKKCAERGKGGAAESGICLKCVTKIVQGKQMRSQIGRAIAHRLKLFRDKL